MATSRTKIIGKKISEMDVAQDLSSNTLNKYSVPLANEAGGDPSSYTNEKAPLDKIKEVVKDDDKVKVQSGSDAKYLSEAISNPNLDYNLGEDTMTLNYPDLRIKSKTIKVNGEIPEDLEDHYKDVSKSVDDVANPTKNIYDLGLEVVSEAATWLNYNDNNTDNGVASLTRSVESNLAYSRQDNEYGGDIDENCGLLNGVYMVYADIGFWFSDVNDELNEVFIRPYINNSLVTGKEVKFFVDHTQEIGYINHKECVFLVKVTDSSDEDRKRINLKAMIDGVNAKAKIFHIQIVAIEQSYINYIESESTEYELDYIHYAHEGKAVSFTSSNTSGVVTYVGASNPNVDGSHNISPISGNGDLSINSGKKYCGLCTLKIESLNPSVNTYQFEASIESAANRTIVVPFTVDASETSVSSVTFDWVAVGIDATSITISTTESIAAGDEIKITPVDYSVFEFGVGKRSGNDQGIEQITRDNTLVGDGVGTPLGVDTVDEEDRVKDFMQPLLDEKQDALTPGDNINIDPDTNEISAVDTTYTAGEGTGLSIDSEDDNKISVNAGNGIGIDSNNNVYIKKGSGLEFSGDVLVVKQGSGVTINENGVNISSGKGIEVDSTSNQVKARLGNGLEFDSTQDTAGIKVKPSNGIEVDTAGVKAKGNTSEGIEVTANGIALKDGDGITFDENGNVVINKGNGLDIDNQKLVVKKGNGLDFSSGALVVKEKTNGGIKVSSTGVELQAKSGGNIKIDSNGDVDVPLESNGGITAGTNGMKLVAPGNGIDQDTQSGALSVKAGKGVDVDGDGVNANINTAKGLKIDSSSNKIEVNIATEAGLEFDDEGKLKCNVKGKVYQEGQGIIIDGDNTDTIKVKLSDESNGLSFDSNGGLKINAEEIETEITEEIETVVDIIKSRILYTMLPASATEANYNVSEFKYGYGAFLGVIFSPSMDIEIIPNETSIVFFVSNAAARPQRRIYAAIYEYDYQEKTISWLANTDNIADQVKSQNLVIGKISKAAEVNEGSTLTITSSKLYYILIIRSDDDTHENDFKFLGCKCGSQLNAIPRIAFVEGNHDEFTDLNADNLNEIINDIDLSNILESDFHLFAAVTNISIGPTPSGRSIVGIKFCQTLGFSTYEFTVFRSLGIVFQEFTPSENMTVYSITVFDTQDPSVYDEEDDDDREYFRGNRIFHKNTANGENYFNLVGDPAGYRESKAVRVNSESGYAHTWTFDTPLELTAGETYLIPIASRLPTFLDDNFKAFKYSGQGVPQTLIFGSANVISETVIYEGTYNHYLNYNEESDAFYVLLNDEEIF